MMMNECHEAMMGIYRAVWAMGYIFVELTRASCVYTLVWLSAFVVFSANFASLGTSGERYRHWGRRLYGPFPLALAL
ncbi:hypothetical protein V8F33_003292 [Rhypophila sp. PSN 637]